MTVIQEAIELIASDRPRWKKEDQQSALRAWKVAFQRAPSELIREAASRFVLRGRGHPTAAKLQALMDKIQEERRIAASRKLTDDISPYVRPPEEIEREKAEIRADLEKNGDPIADYLEARGIPTWRQTHASPQP